MEDTGSAGLKNPTHPDVNLRFKEEVKTETVVAEPEPQMEMEMSPQEDESIVKFEVDEELKCVFSPEDDQRPSSPDMDSETQSPNVPGDHSNGNYSSNGNVKCPNCPELFQSLANMTSHMVGHGPNFQCPICFAWFNKVTGLSCHRKRFHRELPCISNDAESSPSSSRSGSRSHHLKPAKRKPNRVRKFCQICNESFRDTTSLNSHLRSHLGQRPFVCNHCKCTYTRRSILRSHLRGTHGIPDNEMTSAELDPKTLPTPIAFKCSQCPEVFEVLSQCEDHLSHHGDSYYCPHCKVGFRYPSNLATHINKWHKKVIAVTAAASHNQDEDQYHETGEEEEMMVNLEDLKQNCVIVADQWGDIDNESSDNEKDDEDLFICENQVQL